MKIKFFLFILLIYVFPVNLFSQQLIKSENWQENIPSQLKSWIPWVLKDSDFNKCTFAYNNTQNQFCAWFSNLDLVLDKGGGIFKQEVAIEKKQDVMLPGDRDFWPQAVTVNSQRLPIKEITNRPAITLEKGSYIITGNFIWSEMPAKLQVPYNTALVNLSINNKKITNPNIDNIGKIWLREAKKIEEVRPVEQEYLDLKIFRKIIDDIPAKISTKIMLNIGGNEREVILPNILLNSKPYNLISSLPLKLDTDNKLILQVKPGRWEITIDSILAAPLSEIIRPEFEKPIPEQEIWAIEDKPILRNIKIEGVNGINPEQTELPGYWRSFPTYLVNQKDTMIFYEQKRSGPKAEKNSLTLNREIKLHFDAKEYSIKDAINGYVFTNSRLHINNEYSLGRVSINGVDQFLTKIDSNSPVGVEVREGNINLSADSRKQRINDTFSITGWLEDFNSVNIQLMLPPGWKLFHIKGADFVSKSWVSNWNLLDIFLVLLVTISTIKLFSFKIGILFGLACVLTQQDFAYTKLILFIIILLVLTRLIKTGLFFSILNFLKVLFVFYLTVLVISNYVSHIRLAIYPQLESYSFLEGVSQYSTKYDSMNLPGRKYNEYKVGGVLSEEAFSGVRSPSSLAEKVAEPRNQYIYDVNNKVQTGLGFSGYKSRNIYTINWNSPVTKNENFSLYLISPKMNLILVFVSLFLMIGVILTILLNTMKHYRNKFQFLNLKLIVLVFSIFLPLSAFSQSDIPDKQVLDELKNYVVSNLDKVPDCLPSCASIERLNLSNSSESLSFEFLIHSNEQIAIPILGNLENIVIKNIIDKELDKEFKNSIFQNNQLWLKIPKGINKIEIIANLIGNSASFYLPINIGFSTYESKNWKFYGIDNNGKADQTIRIVKSIAEVKKDSAPKNTYELDQNLLHPLIEVKRSIDFANQWTVITNVYRQPPLSSAVNLEIPLIDNEKVTTPNVNVKNGKVLLKLAPNQNNASWSSVLEIKDILTLENKGGTLWSEVWFVNVTNLWNVDFSGTPVITSGSSIPEFRPRPNEKLVIDVKQPVGTSGSTKTIDKVNLRQNLGNRSTNSILTFTVRSSQGENYEFTMPKDAELVSLSINEKLQPSTTNNGKINIPLIPGSQNIKVEWKESRDLNFSYKSPNINLNIPSVDLEIDVNIPNNRWPILFSGPVVGPAILFWGYFPLMLIFAFILSYYKAVPFKFWQWALLMFGISMTSLINNLLIVGFLILLGFRSTKNLSEITNNFKKSFLQILIVFLALITIGALFSAIQSGLLGTPNMRIRGNGSSSFFFKWYQDVSSNQIPVISIYSLPILYYRLIMLFWALWLASTIVKLAPWGWASFNKGGGWYNKEQQASIDNKQGERNADKKPLTFIGIFLKIIKIIAIGVVLLLGLSFILTITRYIF